MSGDSVYLNQTGTKLRRDATLGNNNSGVVATSYHPDNEPVDDVNGEVALVSGVQLADFAKAIAVDFDIDSVTVGLQSVAGILLAIADTLGEIGDDDIVERLTAIKTVVDGITGGGGGSGDVQDVLDAIGTVGTDTLVERLTAVTNAIGTVGSDDLVERLTAITSAIGTVGTDDLVERLTALSNAIGTVGTDDLVERLTAITNAIGTVASDDLVERLTAISNKIGDVGTRNMVDIILALIMGPTELTDETDGTTMKVQDFTGTDYASAKVSNDGERSDSQLL